MVVSPAEGLKTSLRKQHFLPAFTRTSLGVEVCFDAAAAAMPEHQDFSLQA